jgi:hypothetical protein
VLPLALRQLVPGDVALWQLFTNVLLIAGILDFGLSPTLTRYIGLLAAGRQLKNLGGIRQPNEKSVDSLAERRISLQKVVATARVAYLAIALGATLLIGTVGTLAVIQPMNGANAPGSAWQAWGLTVLVSGLSVWNCFYTSLLLGMERVAILRRWEAITATLQVLTVAALLHTGGGLLAIVAANVAWAAAGVARNAWLCRSLSIWSPEEVAPRSYSREVMSEIWRPMWRSGIGILCSQGVLYTSGFIVAQWANGSELASMLLAQRIMMALSQFSQAPFYSKLPNFTTLYAQGKLDDVVGKARRAMFISHTVIAIGVTATGIIIPIALSLINSRVAWVSSSFWLLYATATFVERAGAMHMQLYSLSNHIIWHIANGITGAAMLVQLYVLYPLVGTMAFPISMLTSYALIYSVIALRRSSTHYEQPIFKFEFKASLPPAALSLVILGTAALIR